MWGTTYSRETVFCSATLSPAVGGVFPQSQRVVKPRTIRRSTLRGSVEGKAPFGSARVVRLFQAFRRPLLFHLRLPHPAPCRLSNHFQQSRACHVRRR